MSISEYRSRLEAYNSAVQALIANAKSQENADESVETGMGLGGLLGGLNVGILSGNRGVKGIKICTNQEKMG